MLWDPSELKLPAPFKLIGPSLPIEFCHISKNLGFALIIDEVFGTLCRTYATTSAFTDLKGAIENLRLREGMYSRDDVGYALLDTQELSDIAMARHRHAVETICGWTLHAGYDAVMWTALDNRFDEIAGEPFSVNAAMRFLERLERDDAEAFVRAPLNIYAAPRRPPKRPCASV